MMSQAEVSSSLILKRDNLVTIITATITYGNNNKLVINSTQEIYRKYSRFSSSKKEAREKALFFPIKLIRDNVGVLGRSPKHHYCCFLSPR